MSADDIIERLNRSVVTASNDDMSEPRTEMRSRHVARLNALRDAADEIERLRAVVDAARALRTKQTLWRQVRPTDADGDDWPRQVLDAEAAIDAALSALDTKGDDHG